MARPGISLQLVLIGWLGLQSFSTRVSAQESRYSLEEWITVSRVESFVWSPDGRWLYYSSNAAASGTYEIFRISSEGGDPVQLSDNPPGVRPEPKRGLSISPDGRTLFFTSQRYFEAYDDIYSLPTTGGLPAAITFNDAVIETAPAISPDGGTLAYFARTPAGTRIYLRDLRAPTSWPRALLPASTGERFPTWSPDGRRIAYERAGDIWIHELGAAEARRAVEPGFAGGNGSPVWSPDGSRIAFLSGNSGYREVGVVDVATGRVTPITMEPREHDDVAWSPDGRWLVFVRSDSLGMSNQVVIAAADGSGPVRVLTSGKGIRSSPRYSPDGRWIAYVETTGTRTHDLWKVPSTGGPPRQLTHSMGRIDPARLSTPEEFTYPGADGLAIPSLLYKPRAFRPDRKYPVLVRLHGHPGQWNHSFDPMEHYFLERGFVVVKPNPRGSRGFGQGFHDLHIADYGGAEFEDVLQLLPYLARLGYVDMTRKATWGGSGGGYLSLVIATKAPRAFQAQIIRAPVADWGILAIDRFGASGRAWTATREPRREREEFGGSEAEIPKEYYERSPVNFVDAVEVPQLLFQGLRDTSVPPRQSKLWAQRMRERGKGHLLVYVEYPDEDHSLRRYKATVRDRLQRMTAFLAEHLRMPEIATAVP